MREIILAFIALGVLWSFLRDEPATPEPTRAEAIRRDPLLGAVPQRESAVSQWGPYNSERESNALFEAMGDRPPETHFVNPPREYVRFEPKRDVVSAPNPNVVSGPRAFLGSPFAVEQDHFIPVRGRCKSLAPTQEGKNRVRGVTRENWTLIQKPGILS
jgi:hypothetical protein